MDNKTITDRDLKKQEKYYYLVLLAWPLYLFFLPVIYQQFGIWTLLYMIFPGIFLFTWVGYLMHESWHKYVPGVNHTFFYNAFGIMLLTDPQVYRILHGHHHSKVNTYDDREFHPFGRIEHRVLRAIHNNLEIIFGIAYLSITGQMIVPTLPISKNKFSYINMLIALLAMAAFWGGIGLAAALTFKLTLTAVLIPFLLSLWLNSFMVHQSQLVEHGNLIAEGSFARRNILTRSLTYKGIPEKIFLFFTHGDSREHVLHHTAVQILSRPFPGRLPWPDGAKTITLKDHLGVLKEMITGKEVILK